MAQKSGVSSADVDAFMAELDHPHLQDLAALRALILAADDRVAEGIKWKAPSFFYVDWFATFNLRAKSGVQVIFHTGAKVKASSVDGVEIDDPTGLLTWLARDRCMLSLADMAEIEAKRDQISAIVRQWTLHLSGESSS